MRSEITIFCSNEGELREFVQRLLSRPAQSAVAFPEPVSPQAVIDVPVTLDTPKPARKPRADAGKPRGPYKTTTTGEPAASEPGTTADSVATTPAAPATPTNSAAPSSTPAEATAATEPSTAAEPTEDDARAALGRINATVGLAMQGCMDHLKSFGVDRITKLPKEKYAAFIKSADEKIARLNAGKK